MANIREAAELYIEDCIAGGEPVPIESEASEILGLPRHALPYAQAWRGKQGL